MNNKTNEKEFKLGDKVRVKDDLVVGNIYGGWGWCEGMDKLKGEELIINFTSNNSIRVKGEFYGFSKEMLEHIDDSKSKVKTRIEIASEMKNIIEKSLALWDLDIEKISVGEIKEHLIDRQCPSLFGLSEYGECYCGDDKEQCRRCWNEVEYDIVSKSELEEELEIRQKIPTDKPKDNPVKHSNIRPMHYNAGQFDVIDFCHRHNLNFARGNVVKYVTRAGKKDKSKELEDLKKAMEFLRREIEYLKGENE